MIETGYINTMMLNFFTHTFLGLAFWIVSLPVKTVHSTLTDKITVKADVNIKTTIKDQGRFHNHKPKKYKDINQNLHKTSPDDDVYHEIHLGDEQILITKRACRHLLISYKTPESVIYDPKKDEEKYGIASADINRSNIDVPDRIRIPIRYSRLSRSETRFPFQPSPVDSAFLSEFIDEIPLGFLEFSLKTGDMLFNGKKLTDERKSIIRHNCQKILESNHERQAN